MAVSLQKRSEDAQASLISLLKTQADRGVDLGDLTAQIECAVDYSGSMSRRYRDGEVQTAIERALALSLSGLDDDGVVPVHFFDDRPYDPIPATKDNYGSFVADFLARRYRMGSTNYSKTIEAILAQPVGADDPPKLVLFFTDGAPADKKKTIKLLSEAAHKPVFWQFIGLGYAPEFLRELDTMTGRVVDNVGLTEFSSTTGMTDTQFFDSIVTEFFTSWLPAARKAGITRK